MKIGIIKLGGRISWNGRSTTGSNNDIIALVELLSDHSFEVYTRIMEKDVVPDNVELVDILKARTSDADILLVFNGHLQFHGGVDKPEWVWCYPIINTFKGKVFYMLNDPDLVLEQPWNIVNRKDFGYKREDIEITRTDIEYISTVYDELTVMKKCFNKPRMIGPSKFHYFPSEKLIPLIHEFKNEEKNVDLVYAGSWRKGQREAGLKKYYAHTDARLIGPFQGKIDMADCIGKVNFSKVQDELAKGWATVVIGDKKSNAVTYTNRIYESIMAGNVVFIDMEFDRYKLFRGFNELIDFNYVKDMEDVRARLQYLKENPEFHKRILDEQAKFAMKGIELLKVSLLVILNS